MASEGLRNACTINGITNIAITTVPISDCNELMRSELKFPATCPFCAAADVLGADAGVAGASGVTTGCTGETTGSVEESMYSTYPRPAEPAPPLSLLWTLNVTPGTSATAVLHPVPHFSSWCPVPAPQTERRAPVCHATGPRP